MLTSLVKQTETKTVNAKNRSKFVLLLNNMRETWKRHFLQITVFANIHYMKHSIKNIELAENRFYIITIKIVREEVQRKKQEIRG